MLLLNQVSQLINSSITPGSISNLSVYVFGNIPVKIYQFCFNSQQGLIAGLFNEGNYLSKFLVHTGALLWDKYTLLTPTNL